MSGVQLRSVKNLHEPQSRSTSRVSFKDDTDNYPRSADDKTKGNKPEKEEKNIPVGPFTRFARGVKGFWDTTIIVDAEEDDREAFVRTTLRELLVYLGMVLTLCLIAFLMLDPTMFYLTNVMQGLFVSGPGFDDITNQNQFWSYVEGPLLDGLFKEQYYDGADVHHTELGYIFFENKLFGKPRLRQLRVRNDSCKIHKDMQSVFKRCYGHYALENEETIPFREPLNGTAWTYQTQEELVGNTFLAKRAKYGGGGYVQLLADTKLASQHIVQHLKDNMWLDRGTRVVFIDFTVYNANINMFNIVRLVFEFTATGGCTTYRRFSTIKLLRYVTATDYFVMACEGILFLYLIFYTIEEILEMKKLKWKYLRDFWSLLDLTVILLGYSCIFMNLYRTFKVKTVLKDILDNRDKFGNFELLQYWQELFNDIIAVTCFFAWFKIFKYISFNQTMAHLQGTLSRSAKDVGAFAICFLIIFFGFAHWGYLCFGRQARDYNEFVICLFTLFRIILGDFSFDDMYNANWIFGPVYFVCYIFFVFFVLLNMFLAIINDSYADVKEDMDEDDAVDVGGIFKKGYDKMLSSLTVKKTNIDDIRKALMESDIDNNEVIEFDEWRAVLKARGHHDSHIEAVFAKYDMDGDRMLNAEEQARMMGDLDAQGQEVDEEIEDVQIKKAEAKKLSKLHLRDEDAESDSDESDTTSITSETKIVTNEDFKILLRRVDGTEQSCGAIVSKIEVMLQKLESMDNAKIKHRETMARLINDISQYESQVKGAQNLLAEDGSGVFRSSSSLKSTTTPKGSSLLRPGSNTRKEGGSSLSIKVDS